jgi:hypothetical protein
MDVLVRQAARTLVRDAKGIAGGVPPSRGHKTSQDTCKTRGAGGVAWPRCSPGAPPGHGRRPHPRQLSSRLRFWPAAMSSASVLTRHNRRKRKRRKPCQSCASANSGSTHTLRWRRAFLLIGLGLLVRAPLIDIGFVIAAAHRAAMNAGRAALLEWAGGAGGGVGPVHDQLLGLVPAIKRQGAPAWADVGSGARVIAKGQLADIGAAARKGGQGTIGPDPLVLQGPDERNGAVRFVARGLT